MRALLAALIVVAVADASPATAQPLLNRLATLLTEQAAPGPFIPDVAAAAATRDTVAALLLVELASVPISSSSGGFVYEFRPSVGVYGRATNEFGPFFTERTLRTGSGQMSVGIS